MMRVAENQHILRSEQAGSQVTLEWCYSTYARVMIYNHALTLLLDSFFFF